MRAVSLQVSYWTQKPISGKLKNQTCQLERAHEWDNQPTNQPTIKSLVLETTSKGEVKRFFGQGKERKFLNSCQQVLDVVFAAWRLDCALLQHRRQTAGHATDLSTSLSSTVGKMLHYTSNFLQLYHQNPLHPEIIHKGAGYLSFPVLLLGFLRKDWFGPERVDMERGEARENVDGGVLGIFFPRWPIHFFCSSWVRASRSMSRAEVTS